ncbi:hypothetical protein GCM10010946_34740 [Undibacterium squillarum]|uniref:HNH endonuclease n=1 Tax=Undibacterium squillarum TaxID=1131567 RepID=A0ABQ2Y3G5_9BURK|nr:hypothetical protein GCM10010946_34740 [Undibacterium squillarum]
MNKTIRPAQPSPQLYARRMQSGLYLDNEDGLQKRCACCGEHWPADTEFFQKRAGGDGLDSHCKDCRNTQTAIKKQERKHGYGNTH